MNPPAHKRETYAVKGIFRIDTQFGGGVRTGSQTVFEVRIIHLKARSEQEAKRLAHKRFSRDIWTATWPVEDVARQMQKYVGISRVLCLGGEMEDGEVWYEFSETCPSVERPPGIRAGQRRRAQRKKQPKQGAHSSKQVKGS